MIALLKDADDGVPVPLGEIQRMRLKAMAAKTVQKLVRGQKIERTTPLRKAK
jgi:hypothetical protein